MGRPPVVSTTQSMPTPRSSHETERTRVHAVRHRAIGMLVSMSSSTGVAAPSGMHDVHETERLGPYLRDLMTRRTYLWYVSANELRSRQITNVLGNLWHLLNPVLSIAIYYLIFGLLLKTTRGVDNFLLFLSTGLFLYQYIQKSTTAGAKSIVNNSGLIKAIKFPRVMLPITSTVTETLAALSTFLVIYVVALLTGQAITWRWLMLPGVVALMFVFNLGAAMIAARADHPLPRHHADPAVLVQVAVLRIRGDLQCRRLHRGQPDATGAVHAESRVLLRLAWPLVSDGRQPGGSAPPLGRPSGRWPS